jgi:hypothetical protein
MLLHGCLDYFAAGAGMRHEQAIVLKGLPALTSLTTLPLTKYGAEYVSLP